MTQIDLKVKETKNNHIQNPLNTVAQGNMQTTEQTTQHKGTRCKPGLTSTYTYTKTSEPIKAYS